MEYGLVWLGLLVRLVGRVQESMREPMYIVTMFCYLYTIAMWSFVPRSSCLAFALRLNMGLVGRQAVSAYFLHPVAVPSSSRCDGRIGGRGRQGHTRIAQLSTRPIRACAYVS